MLLGQAAPPLEGQVEEVQRLRQQVRLARLPVVERMAEQDAGGLAGLGQLRVVLVPDRAVLRFSFEHPDQGAAKRGALAAVRAYDELRITERRQRALLDLRRTDAALRASEVAGAPRGDELRKALAGRRARLLVLRDAKDGLTILTTSIQRPYRTTPLRGAAAGALAGLFPAAFLAHQAARRGSRLRRTDAVAAALGAPGLMVLEPFRPGRRARPDSQLGGAYSMAAEGLLALTGAHKTPTVVVVGLGRTDRWVSTVTADLARALVRSGQQVCVVGTGAGGAADQLATGACEAAPDPVRQRLSLVQAKEGERWPDLRGNDLVLVDAPAVSTRALALSAASHAESAVVVVDDRVTREELEAVAGHLVRIGVRPVGHLQVRLRRPRTVLRGSSGRRRRQLVTSPLLASP